MGREKAPVLRFVVFALFCLLFAGWLMVTLGNMQLPFSGERVTYTARFRDLGGLLPNDDVKISGVTVGKVVQMRVDDGGAALVDFTLDASVPLPEDSQILVRWRDAFGLRFLYVEPGDSATLVDRQADVHFDFQRRIVRDGREVDQTIIPTSIGTFLQRITPFVEALDPEIQNEVIVALRNTVMGREEEIQGLVSDGADLLELLASRDEELGRTLSNAAILFDEYAQRDDDIRAVVDSLVDITATLARRNDTLDQAITALADLQGEFGTFIERNEDELRLALDSLETVAATLAEHSDDIDLALSRTTGIIAYHRISRLGQWFDIRAVGISLDYVPLSSERGAALPPRGGASNAASMFEVPLLNGVAGRCEPC